MVQRQMLNDAIHFNDHAAGIDSPIRTTPYPHPNQSSYDMDSAATLRTYNINSGTLMTSLHSYHYYYPNHSFHKPTWDQLIQRFAWPRRQPNDNNHFLSSLSSSMSSSVLEETTPLLNRAASTKNKNEIGGDSSTIPHSPLLVKQVQSLFLLIN